MPSTQSYLALGARTGRPLPPAMAAPATSPTAGGPAPSPGGLGHYQRLGLEARVASASPHMLIALLYERLEQLVEQALVARQAGDAPRRLRATERALAILDGLDSTLDDARGGEVAEALHNAYALVRAAFMSGDAAALAHARGIVSGVAGAWAEIGQRPG